MVSKLLLVLVGSHCLLMIATDIGEGGTTMHMKVVLGRLLVLGLGMMGVLGVGPVTAGERGLSRLVQLRHWGIGGDIVVIKLLEKGATWGVESEGVGVCPKRGVCGMGVWMDALLVSKDVVERLDIKIVLCKGLHLVWRDGGTGWGSAGSGGVRVRWVGVELDSVHGWGEGNADTR
jgi:hypothetical protein